MSRYALLPSFVAMAAVLTLPGAAPAQTTTMPATSDADALAAQMRVIAAEPSNIDALAQAGELSSRLGDLSGAASLFARADKVDPRNGRVKAGMAEVLLRSERPGEALRFFDQAEGYGFPAARFAAERGLAYDLLGQQGRAQRDYRLVLVTGDNAEVRRRYALSLAISGQNEAALQQLEPLIRRNDRGAWRSRAFILAMGGNATAAASIATTMMAPGQAQGLAPFFARLSSLGPVDRAFAVHFGELRPTPQRIADARLAPALSPLAPDVVQVARAAPVAAPAPVRTADRGRRRKGTVQVAAATPLPLPTPAAPVRSATVPIAAPLPTAVAAPPRTAVAATKAAPRRAAGPLVAYYFPGSMLPHYLPRQTAGETAPAAPAPVATATPARVVTPAIAPTPAAATGRVVTPVLAATPTAALVKAPGVSPTASMPTSAAPSVPSAGFSTASVGVAATTAGAASVSTLASTVPPVVAPVAIAPVPRPMATVAVQPSTAAPASTPTPAPAPTASVPADSSVLARIADTLAVPGRELAAAGPATPSEAAPPVTAASPVNRAPLSTDFPPNALVIDGKLTEAGRAATGRRRRTAEIAAAPVERSETATTRKGATADAESAAAPARPEEERSSTRRGRRSTRVASAATDASPADEAPADRKSTDRATDKVSSRHGRREIAAADTTDPTPMPRSRRGSHVAADQSDDTPPPLDRKAAARQAAADRKAATDKKAATEAKALAAKEAADERKAKKADPERYWVQVAGGANEADLPKAWSSARAKAPALAARKGWTTPLRATNRLVTGPFKTDAEARAFVNTLKKQGVSAFQFTSEAGQKINRLDDK
ncbi:MAG: SPOR domain-containing protein [Janthinobacterium lividum]